MKSYLRKIHYYETDQMAVVHHSNYIRYFEEARTSFMEQVGYPYARLEEEKIMSPVVSIACEYRHPVRYNDTIEIQVSLVKMTQTRCAFDYKVLDHASGELRATGHSEHGFLSLDGRIVSIKRENPEFFARFTAELEPAKED